MADLHKKQASSSTTNQNESNKTTNKTKFVGVRQRPSGKWVAEIKNTTQKIRMWLGTFDTAEEAARAYDEAAFLLRGSNTRTNFVDHVPPSSALSLKIRNLLNQKKRLKQSTITKATAKSNSTKISCYSCTIGTPIACGLHQGVQSFDNAYKPDLSNFNGRFEMGNLQFDQSSSDFDVMSSGIDGLVSNQADRFEVPNTNTLCSIGNQMPDFERMKVERQISASLYAMNGVNEYWENVVDDSTSDTFWDLPMLCQTLYLN